MLFMIHFLKGVVEELGGNFLSLDVNGVGYQVFASSRTLGALGVGEVTKIHTTLHVREQEMTLFGFSTPAEKDLFEVLTSVNGVGPKVGLAILSALSTQEILDAITLQDGKMVTRANGVGPKLAERIVRELKGKVGAIPVADGAVVAVQPAGGVGADVVSALVNLGYKQGDASRAVNSAQDKNSGQDMVFDDLFKACLQELR